MKKLLISCLLYTAMEWTAEKKKAAPANFEDIMSRFLKDSEERQQDFKKHQEFKGRSKKSF